LVVSVVGGTVILLGLVLLVIPGPGLLTIALGLAILTSEFLWARRLVARFGQEGTRIRDILLGRRERPDPSGTQKARRSTTELQA
jgi:hypothetical protein